MEAQAQGLGDARARLDALTAHDRTLLVEAGAGSGKTALMAARIALLLASGVPPREIAAVTFTELAASELLARVRDYVEALLAGSVPPEFGAALPTGLADGQRDRLEMAAGSIEEMTCSTIHGFCQRLIAPYPVEADIDPGAVLMDAADADRAFAAVLDRWFCAVLETDDRGVVGRMALRDPAKARSIVGLAANAVRSGRFGNLPPSTSAAPVGPSSGFSAAAEAYSKFCEDAPCVEEETATAARAFGAMARQVFDGEAMSPGFPPTAVEPLFAVPHPSLCTQKGDFIAYRKKTRWLAAAKAAGLSKSDAELLNAEAGRLHQAACDGWDDMKRGAADAALHELSVAVQPVADAFRAYKRSAALLDFDDLIFAARDVLRDHPTVASALSARYRHVLVDEFQDTDPLQMEVLWRLCGDASAECGSADWTSRSIRPGALFLVGDPKQAIYRFRGADVAAYLQAREAIRAGSPDDVLSISTNFRSCAPILTYVNERFAEPLSEARGQPGFEPLAAFHPDHARGPCVVTLEVMCADQDGKADAGTQRAAEAEAVAAICERLIGSRMVIDRATGEGRPCTPRDIALLAPCGTELWRYEEALEAHGVPVSTQAGKGFFRRQEIQDLIAITRVLADPRDGLALLALLRGPLVGLTEEDLLDVVWSQPRDQGPASKLPRLEVGLELDAVAHPVARDVIGWLRALRRKVDGTTPYQLLSEAIDVFRVRPLILDRHPRGAERALANVDAYLSMTTSYGSRGFRAFSHAMRSAWEDGAPTQEGRPDAQEEAVSLVTIHAAKGLEWPIVMLINTMTAGMSVCDPLIEPSTGRMLMPVFGVPPTGYEPAKAEETAERERERIRLWYVAATRARDLLVLPQPNVAPGRSSWNALLDLDLANLPAMSPDEYPGGFAIADAEGGNFQSSEKFALEGEIVRRATRDVRWSSPSRDEGRCGTTGVILDLLPFDDEQTPPDFPSHLRGGRMRGLVVHKLFEEVLTGETAGSAGALSARAGRLIASLGADDEEGEVMTIVADEVAGAVLRTLSLPEISPLVPRMVAELPVYGSTNEGGCETATFGVVDALVLDGDGRPELVIDWKSDVAPTPAAAEHYRSQVRRYVQLTGAAGGMVVFVTTGKILRVDYAVSG